MAAKIPLDDPKAATKVAMRLSNAQLPLALPAAGPLAYLIGLILRLETPQLWYVLGHILLPVGLVFLVIAPNVSYHVGAAWALARIPGERPGARLGRILELPRRLEVAAIFFYGACAGVGTALCCAKYDKSYWNVVPCMLIVTSFNFLLSIVWNQWAQRILAPFAVAEFHQNPVPPPPGWAALRPRWTWYLPYAFGSFFVCLVVSFGVAVAWPAERAVGAYAQSLVAQGALARAAEVRELLNQVGRDLIVPLGLLGSFVLAIATGVAFSIARRQAYGTQRLMASFEALAAGRPRMPDFIATEELGDFSVGIARALGRLSSMSTQLRDSARQLLEAAQDLHASNQAENEVLSRQASGLQQTQVTAQEIRQTSVMAAQTARRILDGVEHAQQVGTAGAARIKKGMDSLEGIRAQVTAMSARISGLGERTAQLTAITQGVKDLADQSNLLALNAAIEAVRSGEHGKGFAVVAREIRTLADSSIQNTDHAREILRDLGVAIHASVKAAQEGVAVVQDSLGEVRASGDHMSELSETVQRHASAVRQIVGAVDQQSAGVQQIFDAVTDQSRMMNESLERLRATDAAAARVLQVARLMDQVAAEYSLGTQAPDGD